MRRPLALKVFAAVFGTAALLVAAMTLAAVWRADRSFARYVQGLELDRLHGLVEQLQRDRLAYGDWRFVPGDPQAYRDWLHRALGGGSGRGFGDGPGDRPGPGPDRRPPPEPGPPDDGDPGPPREPPGRPPRSAGPDFRPPLRAPPQDRLALLQRVALFDADGRRVGGAHLAIDQLDTLPIVVAGQTVGHVGLQPKTELVAAGEQMFLRSQGRDALLVGLAALALSALVSLAFARHLRRPVRQLVDGTRALAEGGLSARLPTGRDDEFGLIAEHFNRMAGQLEQQQRQRREWLASTSHELRTPLTVLQALIEALQEGIRRGDPATLQRLHEQVLALSRLVDDLHRLAQHDAGQVQLALQTVQPLRVIAAVLDAQRQRLLQAGIQVELIDQTADATLTADRQRLAQLFLNLVENTLRYTDAPGRLRVTLSMTGPVAGRQWQAVFDDSAPTVAAAALPRLFEPFYRGEASRSRATGGSGLGLAICHAIADEHRGQISAQASTLGGLCITLRLPA